MSDLFARASAVSEKMMEHARSNDWHGVIDLQPHYHSLIVDACDLAKRGAMDEGTLRQLQNAFLSLQSLAVAKRANAEAELKHQGRSNKATQAYRASIRV